MSSTYPESVLIDMEEGNYTGNEANLPEIVVQHVEECDVTTTVADISTDDDKDSGETDHGSGQLTIPSPPPLPADVKKKMSFHDAVMAAVAAEVEVVATTAADAATAGQSDVPFQDQEGEVETADAPFQDQEGEVETADAPFQDQEGEVETADAPFQDQEGEVETADAPFQDQEGEVETADAPIQDQEGEVETADVPLDNNDTGSVGAEEEAAAAAVVKEKKKAKKRRWVKIENGKRHLFTVHETPRYTMPRPGKCCGSRVTMCVIYDAHGRPEETHFYPTSPPGTPVCPCEMSDDEM